MAKPSAVLKVSILSDFNPRGINDASGAFDKFHKGALAASTAIVGGFAVAAGKSVKDASNLAEAVNATSVVFGDASGKIHDFGKTAVDTVGLSNRSFNELAAKSGGLLKNLGYSADEAADSTISLADRAADMASVYNTDVGPAMDAITAALRGSNEPLLQYGVRIDDASTKAKAMEMGLWDGTGALDAHSKALAIEAQILEQTTDIAGDFDNTADSLANRQRRLTEATENVSAQMGEALLPIMESLVGILQSAVQWISENEELFKTLVATLAGLAATYLSVTAAVKGYNAVKAIANGAMKIFTDETVIAAAKTVIYTAKLAAQKAVLIATEVAQKAVIVVTKAWAVAQKLLNAALKANPIGIIITIIGALVAIVIKAYQESETFRNIVDAIANVIKTVVIGAFERLSNVISTVVDWVKEAWRWVQKLIDRLKNIKMPSISFPSLPWNRSSTLTLRDSTGRRAGSSTASNGPVNIYVTGAVDPVGTAQQIQSLLNRQKFRMGAPSTLWDRAVTA